MIDQATIDRIMDTADIVEVVEDFVSLKKRGVNYLGLCPFHNEKTPSFTVSPGKQIFKCFGCGKGGSPVNFIMEHEHLSFVDALKYLAKKYHIEIQEKDETPEDIAQRNQRESLLIVSNYAKDYFANTLFNDNEGRTVGLAYFRERGFRDDIIKKFELGFNPGNKDTFTQAALRNGYKMEFLEGTGLSIKRDDWVRDRFAGRVVFPFHNLAGRVIAFGGRILKTDPKAAKYLNSPESEIYHKSKVLYGIYFAKNAISRSDKCYLVEGYTDVLSFHQSGIENVVASSGTSLTADQIRLIKRFTPNITIIYDGDKAGIKASLRGIDMVLEEGVNVKVVPLPDGEDPDSFARSMSSSELLEYISQNEIDFIRFKTQILLNETENDPVTRARVINDIVRSIAVIPDNITRSVYIKECSKMLDVAENLLYTEVRKIKFKLTEDQVVKEKREELRQAARDKENAQLESTVIKPGINPCEIEEKALLRVLIRYFGNDLFTVVDEKSHEERIVKVGEYILSEIEADNLNSVNPVVYKIIEEFKEHQFEEFFDPQRYFAQHADSEVNSMVSGLLVDKHIESVIWRKNGAYVEDEDEVLFTIVPRLIEEYKLRHVKLMISEIMKKIGSVKSSDNLDEIFELQRIITKLKKVEKELSKKLGKRAITS
ncbi:MAG: DNA primase [Prolixibacteraceae bacterium]|nr:DNA primase [Prolixibacteraceae bacterium]MBN2649626.1 DNA primase [Prolixibacteraceae bacterium]